MIRHILLICFSIVAVAAGSSPAVDVSVSVDPNRVLNPVDEKIYGHFLEHIYHSCNGGLWGELIWNRSFEQNNLGQWRVEEDQIIQDGLAENQRLVFGDPEWSDYELTLEARKTGGNEGFLILFRVKNEDAFYWLNLGGWGNQSHQLERGIDDGNRWHPIGPNVRGRIEGNRWYRIRIRCEGRHIQAFLDDQPLIDFTDDERANMRGRVGVGTWSTQARFRNVKVVSLDKDVLFEGVPTTKSRPTMGKHWEFFGEGEASIVSGDALNGRFCQRIVGHGGETGIQQASICVRRFEEYVGSLWARGESAGALVVRLVDGDTRLAESQLDRPTSDWREYPFSLVAQGDTAHATIQVGLAGGGDICVDQISMMPKTWQEAGGFRPDLLQAIADLKPPVIRWPGGCFASSYRWKQGIGPQHERLPHPREIWDDLDVYSFGTDEFVAMCRRVGAEPIIVINIGTPTWNGPVERKDFLQEALDWIEYCNGPADSKWGQVRAAHGHPEPYQVKYWEIDNETWHMGARRYADAVNIFGPAMRHADPSIRLIACGSNVYDQDWNREVIQHAGLNFDYISTHHYEDPNRYASGPARDEAFFRELKKVIDDGPNPKIKIDCSEWNAQSTDWRTGLYCGGILNAFERCGAFFEIGGPALFLRHVSATAWDNSFINFDQCRWFPAPNYVVMQLWRDHYAPQRIAVDGELGILDLVATKSSDGKTLFLKAVNTSDRPAAVRVAVAGNMPIGPAEMKMVAPGDLNARNTLDHPDGVRAESHPVTTDGRTVSFEMPPLSVGVITLRSGSE